MPRLNLQKYSLGQFGGSYTDIVYIEGVQRRIVSQVYEQLSKWPYLKNDWKLCRHVISCPGWISESIHWMPFWFCILIESVLKVCNDVYSFEFIKKSKWEYFEKYVTSCRGCISLFCNHTARRGICNPRMSYFTFYAINRTKVRFIFICSWIYTNVFWQYLPRTVPHIARSH